VNRTLAILASQILLIVASSSSAFAQQPEGPQTSAPTPIGPEVRPAVERRAGPSDKITVPAGTRVAVVMENGISTRSAKAGDSLYFRTSFPITQNNHVIVSGWFLSSRRAAGVEASGPDQGTRRISHALEYFDFSERLYGRFECGAAQRGQWRKRNNGFRKAK